MVKELGFDPNTTNLVDLKFKELADVVRDLSPNPVDTSELKKSLNNQIYDLQKDYRTDSSAVPQDSTATLTTTLYPGGLVPKNNPDVSKKLSWVIGVITAQSIANKIIIGSNAQTKSHTNQTSQTIPTAKKTDDAATKILTESVDSNTKTLTSQDQKTEGKLRRFYKAIKSPPNWWASIKTFFKAVDNALKVPEKRTKAAPSESAVQTRQVRFVTQQDQETAKTLAQKWKTEGKKMNDEEKSAFLAEIEKETISLFVEQFETPDEVKQLKDLIKSGFNQEASDTQNRGALFRGTQVHQKLATEFYNQKAGEWAETIVSKLIAKIPEESLEIQPGRKDYDESKVEDRQDKIMELTRYFVSEVGNQMYSLDPDVKDLMGLIAIEGGHRFGKDAAQKTFDSQLFLRFLSPMITKQASKPDALQKLRTAVLVAKIVQNHANQIKEKKESFLKFSSPEWLNQNLVTNITSSWVDELNISSKTKKKGLRKILHHIGGHRTPQKRRAQRFDEGGGNISPEFTVSAPTQSRARPTIGRQRSQSFTDKKTERPLGKRVRNLTKLPKVMQKTRQVEQESPIKTFTDTELKNISQGLEDSIKDASYVDTKYLESLYLAQLDGAKKGALLSFHMREKGNDVTPVEFVEFFNGLSEDLPVEMIKGFVHTLMVEKLPNGFRQKDLLMENMDLEELEKAAKQYPMIQDVITSSIKEVNQLFESQKLQEGQDEEIEQS